MKRITKDYPRALNYLVIMLIAFVATTGAVLYFSNGEAAALRNGKVYTTATEFEGGPFEASGAARVPGVDAILFVDDGKSDSVQFMRLDGEGKQAGAIESVSLGVQIVDPEGITTDGTYFYIVGSQSKKKSAEGIGLIRFKFNPETRRAENVESISNLRLLLSERVAELRGLSTGKPKDEELDIEGLAWDPIDQRLLLGLRAPVVEGRALVVPFKLSDPRGPFSEANLAPGEATALRVDLGGHGVRGIEYDEQSKQFLIVAGAPGGEEKTDFRLVSWSGGHMAEARVIATFDRKLQPEGVTRASAGGNEFTLVVFDSSRYLKIH